MVVGSKGGADTHPEWYRNMSAVPDIVVQVRDELVGIARTATGTERAELWTLMRQFPNYEQYQQRTDHEIPSWYSIGVEGLGPTHPSALRHSRARGQ